MTCVKFTNHNNKRYIYICINLLYFINFIVLKKNSKTIFIQSLFRLKIVKPFYTLYYICQIRKYKYCVKISCLSWVIILKLYWNNKSRLYYNRIRIVHVCIIFTLYTFGNITHYNVYLNGGFSLCMEKLFRILKTTILNGSVR